MKRKFTYIIVAIIAVVLTTTYLTINKYSIKAIEGEVEVLAYGPYYDYLNLMAIKFKEKYPNTNIKIKNIKKENLDSEIQNAAKLNKEADLILMNSLEVQKYIRQNSMVKNSIDGTINSFINSYDNGRLDEIEKDKSYYAMPFDGKPMVMYYDNKALLDASIKIEDIKTWKDFKDAGTAFYVKSLGNKKLCYLTRQDMINFTKMLLYQIDIKKDSKYEDKKKFVITFIESLKKENVIEEVEDADKVMQSTMIFGSMDRFELIKSIGKSTFQVSYIPSLDIGGNKFVSLDGENLVLANRKNEKTALEFMVFAMTSASNLNNLMLEKNVFPVFKSCYEDEVFDYKQKELGGGKYLSILNNIQINEPNKKNIELVDEIIRNMYK
ncbi:ABC-type glycerol-3-phosphate transport system, substrate-binding protein [Clostridium cavendishii DSM 21758]|uniref:ABC-type glycerol-3-phosphate transport system, substrate-binding protein n=1 Tax=Clostridium cavendishii DSM 21758 TaxID=1121302 RepID=A0A1M6U7P3_9CLOT|nr:extracellular solute-binding protein [Clostridium cavendishii]SHK65193.1 ABC-type glycerol-3-phosphate transport system, substrate-binding protein [Clostridium cavendishii DSM 21758]